jgi:hypothetical protein
MPVFSDKGGICSGRAGCRSLHTVNEIARLHEGRCAAVGRNGRLSFH